MNEAGRKKEKAKKGEGSLECDMFNTRFTGDSKL